MADAEECALLVKLAEATDLLDRLKADEASDNVGAIWWDLRRLLYDEGTRPAYQECPGVWQAALLERIYPTSGSLDSDPSTGVRCDSQGSRSARIGALWLMGQLAGHDEYRCGGQPDRRKVWETIVLPIARGYPVPSGPEDDKHDVDLRSWATYLLSWAGGREVTPDKWSSEVLGKALNALLEDEQPLVRQWAAIAIRNMAEQGGLGEDRDKHRASLTLDARGQVECAIISQWRREISWHVERELIRSLASVGGYVDGGSAAASLLATAASARPRQVIWEEIPDAVKGVAQNVAHPQGEKGNREATLNDLAEVIEAWLEDRRKGYNSGRKEGDHGQAGCKGEERGKRCALCNEWIRAGIARLGDLTGLTEPTKDMLRACRRSASGVLQTEGLEYDTYRAAIKLVETVVSKGMCVARSLTEEGIECLLSVIDGRKVAAPNQAACYGPEGERVRSRAATTIECLDWSAGPENRRRLARARAVAGLKIRLAEESSEVANAVTTALTKLEGPKEALGFYVDFILGEEDATAAVRYRDALMGGDGGDEARARQYAEARKHAAAAIRSISSETPGYKEQYGRLTSALQEEPDSLLRARARNALMTIGGEEALSALAEMRAQVEAKYFASIDDADKQGKKILWWTVSLSVATYVFTLTVAVIVVCLGTWLIRSSVASLTDGAGKVDWKGVAIAAGGAITAIAGLLAPFFWNPSGAVQKANAEMTKLVTAFHGYMGRMRLVGLGFAYAYQKENWTKPTPFLRAVSDAAGDAMLDSAGVLAGLGFWPGAKRTVQVPELTDMSWAEAKAEAETRALEVDLKDQKTDKSKLKGQVVDQSPVSGSWANVGDTIELTVSMGPR